MECFTGILKEVHNFADGFVIGWAFLGCGNAIDWTVTASTVMHEIPHEVTDFRALLNGGMSVKQVWVKERKRATTLKAALLLTLLAC